MLRKKRINLLQDDSDDDEVEMQEMKVCYVGQLKHKFIIKVDIELDDVIEVKSEILERLGLSTPDDGYGTGINSTNPWMKKIKLFSLKGGLELSNKDRMGSVQGQQYLYYSFGEPFDYTVRMEFIDIERKLGEGGFGSVYLGYDKLLSQQVAIKLLNFGSSIKNSNMITKEIDALGQLRHKNIVKLLDYFPLPKKQQLIVVMEYLKGGELDDLWKGQPMRRFSERNAYHLFIQLMNAIDYCHNSKIIHRDMKFQNVMLAEVPKYKKDGKLDISSVNLKVVDFGIFGSISGIRLENVNFGSLRFMAPELLQGDIKSTTKIDIWSLGLMLHAMVFGFLPFNANERNALEQQILNDEIEYTNIKKLKTSSIKNEVRRALNIMLKNTSDELIDLIEKMLNKDPEQRIDNLSVFEHPWIMKYRYDGFQDDYDSSEDKQQCDEKNSMDSNNSDFFADEKMQETNFDSDPVQLDNRSSRGTSSPNSFMNSEIEKGKGGRSYLNQILKNHFMFNIEEHDNETTGNFVKVDLKQKKPPPAGVQDGCVPEEEVPSNQKRPSYKKKNSKLGVIRHVSLKKSNMMVTEEKERVLKRSNLLIMDEKRQSTANNGQDAEFDRNSRNLSQNTKNDEMYNQNCPFALLQNHSSQDGVNINSMRSKTIKKKRKIMKKNNNAIDGDYEMDINYQQKGTKLGKKNQKSNNYGANDSVLDKKISNEFGAENSYIIEGPREGVEAQNIRLNIAMEKSSKMNVTNNRINIEKIKPTSKASQYKIDSQNTIEKGRFQPLPNQKKDFLPVPNKLVSNYNKILLEDAPSVMDNKKTPNGQTNTQQLLGPLRNALGAPPGPGRPNRNFGVGSNSIAIVNVENVNMKAGKDPNSNNGAEDDNEGPFQQAANQWQQPNHNRFIQSTGLPRSRQNSRRMKNNQPAAAEEESNNVPAEPTITRNSQPQKTMYKLSKVQVQKFGDPDHKYRRTTQDTINFDQVKKVQSYSCEKYNQNKGAGSSVPLTNHARSDIGNHLVQQNNQGECSFLPVPMATGVDQMLKRSHGSSPRQVQQANMNIIINNKQLIIGPDSPLRLKKKHFDFVDSANNVNIGKNSSKGHGNQPILQSLDKISVKQDKISVKCLDTDNDKYAGGTTYMSCQRPQESGNQANYNSNNVLRQQPRRNIQFYKMNQVQQQVKGGEQQMLNYQYSVKEEDRQQQVEKMEYMRATSAGANNQRFQQLQKVTIFSNSNMNSQFPISSNNQNGISLQSHRSNDALAELSKNDNEIQSANPAQLHQVALQLNTQGNQGQVNKKVLHSSKFRNKTQQGAPNIFSEIAQQNKAHNKTTRNIAVVNNQPNNDRMHNNQNFLIHQDRKNGTQDGMSEKQDVEHAPVSQLLVQGSGQQPAAPKEPRERSFDQNLIITPVKKVLDGSSQYAGVTGQKISVKCSNQNSNMAEMLQKYQTIENTNAKSKPSKVFKNSTQQNFNQGGVHVNQANYKMQQTENYYNHGGPQTMMGQSTGLLSQIDRSNRGTAGNVSKRTADKIKTFSIKGQAIQPMQNNLNLGNVVNQARQTQSDMKRSRNLTQTDDPMPEGQMSQGELKLPKFQGSCLLANSTTTDGLRLPQISNSPTPENKE